MTTTFSTKSNQNIEDPLYRLLFSDEDQDNIKTEDNPLDNLLTIKIEKPKKIKEKASTIKSTDNEPEKTIEVIPDKPIEEKIKFNPIAIKPETELDKENKSSILEHLVYNLNKLKIPHTIKTFGYHTTDDFITTEYTVIDELSKNTILIVHLTKKQIFLKIMLKKKEKNEAERKKENRMN